MFSLPFSLTSGKIWSLSIAGILALGGFVMKNGSGQPPQDRVAQEKPASSRYELSSSNWVSPSNAGSTTKSTAKTSSSASFFDQFQQPDKPSPASNQLWGDSTSRLGISFGLAVLMGVLVRAFVKTVSTIAVIVGALLFSLSQMGLIDPFWQQEGFSTDGIKEWLTAQTDNVRQFLSGYLPSAGAATVGFGYGLKK